MKRILIFLFSIWISLTISSCSSSAKTTTDKNTVTTSIDETLPVDTTIKKGVLPNGMTYYIKNTDVVKDAASYYIIQNVGSILENDDQQGLAHFLEHMAFNGTKNFPGKGILNTLQKHGAVFGKDINAYTSFDETVYNLNNIPTKDGLVDTCLTVLNDWSNYLLLTEEEIDSERGVIKEEWRTRQNGQMRLFETSLPITLNYSKYADRLPIGLMSVVENFDYKALRDFYHDWYRTDLQAIAVIGDVNVDEIEKKIIEKFSKIPAIENPKERYLINIPDNEGMLYSLAKDPEVSTASINFGMRHDKSLKTETVSSLKRSLLESMAIKMLSSRISEQSQKPEATFLGAQVGYGGSYARTSNNFYTYISPKENQQQAAFKDILTEIERAVKFGYIQSEINRTISSIKSSYENRIAQEDNRSHGQIERIIQSNFLTNRTIVDVKKQYEIVKTILNSITKEELHQTIKGFYIENNRYLNVTGVEGQDNLTEAQARSIIENVENDATITPYTEDLGNKTLVSDLDIKSGSIATEKANDNLGETTFVLSNGVKVHYKFVDKEKDKVALKAVSYGGKSLLNDDDLPSADFIGGLAGMSGLGDFTAIDLGKVLAGKTAGTKISLGEITENISGSSNTKDVETMLQMVYLRFVKPRFDAEVFKVLQSNVSNYLVRRGKDIGEQMRDSLTIALYGKNNPKKLIFNQDYVDKISFSKIESLYKDRFADASDFEFFIVGDVNEAQLKPLLEKYIASIPTKNIKEDYKVNVAEWKSDKIDEDIYIAMEDPKSSVNISYKKEMPYSLKNSIFMDVLGDILQLRVLETVRESEGGAYSPRAYAYLLRQPKSQAYIGFRFDCNPDLADKLVTIVNEELVKITNGTINDDDLNKTRTNFIKARKQSKDKNGYDMSLLTNFYRYNYNMNDPKNFEDIVNKMSKEDIQSVAKQVLDGGKSYEVVFRPKQ